jgi:predicted MPP superfamily phosphohydrolase
MRRLPLPFLGHVLAAPETARSVARSHFDPREGWFRTIERNASRFLSRRVFPLVPGIELPYAWALDRWLECSEAEITVRGLRPGLDGFSLLLITDLHAGPFLSPRALKRALVRASSTTPDLVLLGGDYATTHLGELEPHLEALASLEAPLGVFAVLGNHDHYTESAPRLREMIESTGARVLHNDAVPIERGGGRLLLAGIDDLHWGKPDLDEALSRARGLDPEAPIVLLSHNPDVFFEAAARGVSLVLSGHTHGGQVRIPGGPVLVRMSRYRLDDGRFRFGGAELVVSRGLGVSGLPLRLGCPPEVVRLTLRGQVTQYESSY